MKDNYEGVASINEVYLRGVVNRNGFATRISCKQCQKALAKGTFLRVYYW